MTHASATPFKTRMTRAAFMLFAATSLSIAVVHASELQPVAKFQSVSGEDLDTFVTRVAPEAFQLTVKLDAQVCAPIGLLSDGTYTLELTTSNSPWKCALYTLPADVKWTGEVFRTHALRDPNDWTESEMRLPGYLVTESKLTYRNRNVWRKLADY